MLSFLCHDIFAQDDETRGLDKVDRLRGGHAAPDPPPLDGVSLGGRAVTPRDCRRAEQSSHRSSHGRGSRSECGGYSAQPSSPHSSALTTLESTVQNSAKSKVRRKTSPALGCTHLTPNTYATQVGFEFEVFITLLLRKKKPKIQTQPRLDLFCSRASSFTISFLGRFRLKKPFTLGTLPAARGTAPLSSMRAKRWPQKRHQTKSSPCFPRLIKVVNSEYHNAL